VGLGISGRGLEQTKTQKSGLRKHLVLGSDLLNNFYVRRSHWGRTVMGGIVGSCGGAARGFLGASMGPSRTLVWDVSVPMLRKWVLAFGFRRIGIFVLSFSARSLLLQDGALEALRC